MILSASRRTDIPGYYSEWFINRLRAGYVLTKNPMNPNQVSRINLAPDKIDCIVFWTKDPVNMMDKLPVLDQMGYHYYFQFTITPYDKEIERFLRDKKDITATFRQLSRSIGKERVIWRYDPIIINHHLTMEYHVKHFESLCQELGGYTDICIISFVDLYNKLNKKATEGKLQDISRNQIYQIGAEFSGIARKYGIELRACCEELNLIKEEIKRSACIDKEIMERICGHKITVRKDKNQRAGCGCAESVDIGVYNTCRNGCIYCYANHSDASIERNYQRHDMKSDLLIGALGDHSRITDRN